MFRLLTLGFNALALSVGVVAVFKGDLPISPAGALVLGGFFVANLAVLVRTFVEDC